MTKDAADNKRIGSLLVSVFKSIRDVRGDRYVRFTAYL